MEKFDYKKYIQENRITIGNGFDIHKYVKDTVMEDVVKDVIDGMYGPKMKTELRRISSSAQLHEWANSNFPDVVNEAKKVAKNIDELFEAELNEADEPEIITQIRDIVSSHQAKKLKDPVSGKMVMIDAFTANAISQVYDLLSTKHKELYAKKGLPMMANFAMKMMK